MLIVGMLAAVSMLVCGPGTEAVLAGEETVVRDCHLEVDGVVHVEGACRVFPLGERGYTLNVRDAGKPERSHFAQVTELTDGDVVASWNADPDADHAWDDLGQVTLEDGCWVNPRVRICAR